MPNVIKKTRKICVKKRADNTWFTGAQLQDDVQDGQ